jgi:hypothetical protein
MLALPNTKLCFKWTRVSQKHSYASLFPWSCQKVCLHNFCWNNSLQNYDILIGVFSLDIIFSGCNKLIAFQRLTICLLYYMKAYVLCDHSQVNLASQTYDVLCILTVDTVHAPVTTLSTTKDGIVYTDFYFEHCEGMRCGQVNLSVLFWYKQLV